MAVYKVNVSLPPDLVGEIDSAATDLGLTRSGFIAEASARYVTDVRNLTADERRHKDIERAAATFKRIGSKVPRDHDLLERLRTDRERDTPPDTRR
ncbi:MAG: hypothetical protein C0418_05300 [Coriobacteriaceae bacterium]|nr:hypothetical protein [Coriobacteriaceae bacterium]